MLCLRESIDGDVVDHKGICVYYVLITSFCNSLVLDSQRVFHKRNFQSVTPSMDVNTAKQSQIR